MPSTLEDKDNHPQYCLSKQLLARSRYAQVRQKFLENAINDLHRRLVRVTDAMQEGNMFEPGEKLPVTVESKKDVVTDPPNRPADQEKRKDKQSGVSASTSPISRPSEKEKKDDITVLHEK